MNLRKHPLKLIYNKTD